MKTKFIKNYKLFVKENLGIEETELPEEVQKTVDFILKMNFDKIRKPIIKDNKITFGVTEEDGKLEPEKILKLELGEGPMKKREYDVTLIFEDKKVHGNPDNPKYELTYLIEFGPKSVYEEEPENLIEDEEDSIEPNEDLTPEEILSRGDRDDFESNKHLKSLDDFFTTGNLDFEDDE